MRQTHPISFVLIFILLLAEMIPAFSQKHTFNKVLSPYGNFSIIVGGITQDDKGYMWLSSGRGLYRYDGYQFKQYIHDPTDSNSIASNRLETVYADRQGIIWIANWTAGIDRFDPSTGKFSHYKHDPNDPQSLSSDSVKCLLEDRDGNFWVGTNSGLDKFDRATGKFQNYRHDPNDPSSISCNHTRRIIEDKSGTIWVATGTIWGEGCKADEGGLNRFDKRTGKFIRYLHDPKDRTSIINNKIQGLYEDSRGTFWVGTAGDGLHTMDRERGTFERHLYDPAHPEKLSRPPLRNGTFIDYITFITEDALGGIWIGTLGNGVNFYDPKSQKVTHHVNESSNDGFAANGAWTFCNSKDGVLWLGTFQGTLFRMDPFYKKIPHVFIGASVMAITEDKANNLWLGTVGGLIRQNRITNATKKFVNQVGNPTTISHNTIRSLMVDREGTLWIGTSSGLNRFNSPTETFTQYQHRPDDPTNVLDGNIYALEEGGGDTLWIGSANGMGWMNKHTGTFTTLNTANKQYHELVNVVALQKDRSGNLWIGTYTGGGLFKYNLTSGTFENFIYGKFIISLAEDSQGRIWAGTEGEGVWSSDSGDNFIHLKESRYGIENVGVGGVFEDDQQNLWLNTMSGVVKVDPKTKQSILYGANEGLEVGNMNGITGFQGLQGEIYLGTATGYYIFSPEQLVGNPNPPQLILTDFRIDGKSLLEDIESQSGSIKAITIAYDKSVISIGFAGIHFSNPGYNRHQYMLEKYDRDWHDAGIDKTSSYFNVPPGEYVFRVRAAANEGMWTEKQIHIVITPPWWRTWWAIGLYGIVFIAGVFGVDRIQRQAVIRTEREKARAREFEQAKEIEKAYKELKSTQSLLVQSEKMASLGELTAGIAHEIQNPLNFVNNFSEVNKELITEMNEAIEKEDYKGATAIAKDISDNQEKINQHGKRADAIVKSMLLHSRKSSGQKELTDINALCDEYLRLSYHGLRAKDKSFNAKFELQLDPALPQVNVVPQDMGRVILNLINNAFYAVSQKNQPDYEPTVLVSTKKSGNYALISIKDNGDGIPDSIKEKIFQPFFTTKPTGQGTGLGLSLSFDIVKAHGGELKLETRESEGSEFIIQLPIV